MEREDVQPLRAAERLSAFGARAGREKTGANSDVATGMSLMGSPRKNWSKLLTRRSIAERGLEVSALPPIVLQKSAACVQYATIESKKAAA